MVVNGMFLSPPSCTHVSRLNQTKTEVNPLLCKIRTCICNSIVLCTCMSMNLNLDITSHVSSSITFNVNICMSISVRISISSKISCSSKEISRFMQELDRGGDGTVSMRRHASAVFCLVAGRAPPPGGEGAAWRGCQAREGWRGRSTAASLAVAEADGTPPVPLAKTSREVADEHWTGQQGYQGDSASFGDVSYLCQRELLIWCMLLMFPMSPIVAIWCILSP